MPLHFTKMFKIARGCLLTCFLFVSVSQDSKHHKLSRNETLKNSEKCNYIMLHKISHDWSSKARCWAAVRKCLGSTSLGQSLDWAVSVREGRKVLEQPSRKKKEICSDLNLERDIEGERMPVMGVLGGGGGRLQRSSSVGRGDEARALTPSQPPRRAHSFRFPFVKFKTVSKSGTTSPNTYSCKFPKHIKIHGIKA